MIIPPTFLPMQGLRLDHILEASVAAGVKAGLNVSQTRGGGLGRATWQSTGPPQPTRALSGNQQPQLAVKHEEARKEEDGDNKSDVEWLETIKVPLK